MTRLAHATANQPLQHRASHHQLGPSGTHRAAAAVVHARGRLPHAWVAPPTPTTADRSIAPPTRPSTGPIRSADWAFPARGRQPPPPARTATSRGSDKLPFRRRVHVNQPDPVHGAADHSGGRRPRVSDARELAFRHAAVGSDGHGRRPALAAPLARRLRAASCSADIAHATQMQPASMRPNELLEVPVRCLWRATGVHDCRSPARCGGARRCPPAPATWYVCGTPACRPLPQPLHKPYFTPHDRHAVSPGLLYRRSSALAAEVPLSDEACAPPHARHSCPAGHGAAAPAAQRHGFRRLHPGVDRWTVGTSGVVLCASHGHCSAENLVAVLPGPHRIALAWRYVVRLKAAAD